MNAPFFSVVTPSWNQGEWIDGCIQSVLAQGAADFEHIVFDNCSTDSTASVLGRHPHLITRVEQDSGQSNALNRAFALARGEIICWLNADDQYLPGAFDIVRREFAKPEVDVIFGDCEEDFCDGLPPRIRRARFERREDMLIWWEKRTDLLQPAVFFRRSLLAEVGPLREDLHVVMDTELWWRMSERHKFHRVEAALARQQRQPDSKTIKHMPRIYEEKDRVFTPLLNTAQPDRRARNAIARRIGMGRRWLGLAQSAAAANPEAAPDFLRRARKKNPLLVLSPRWWAAIYHTPGMGHVWPRFSLAAGWILALFGAEFASVTLYHREIFAVSAILTIIGGILLGIACWKGRPDCRAFSIIGYIMVIYTVIELIQRAAIIFRF